MILSGMALAMVMNMTAVAADPQEVARKGFNNCLVEEHNKAVSEKKSGAEFNEQLATACTETRKSYFDLIVKSEKSYGSKQAEAEEYANGELQSVIDSITSAFSENVANGAKLQPEK
jgi:hypothetical protein